MLITLDRETSIRSAKLTAAAPSGYETFSNMGKTDQDDLLVQIAQGNKAAVSEFIDRYGGLLWSLAMRFTQSTADAEDAVQEVFLELWRKAERFDPSIASEKTFVSMVARRRLIDRARGKTLPTTFEPNLDLYAESAATPADNLETKEEAALALRLLNELPSEQTRMIKLAIYDGLSHSQISEVTGTAIGTVKTNIRRGLNKIRQRIGIPSAVDLKGGIA
ncbi:MAG TPA: sigma-70 family RNA polymerase sigma factor [Pirellulaceae bacterium]|nr:sigma-70 family RNA polymerase sigma factor [Pirellulaceae bacterium]HMO91236.1 sigma-70 family RNA polymerase sigma factor [Pirellulaceae bacterium]HMP68580.1 sigma-70 family RNA polymerase sigma factor [Pirellulaceae bacterium]